MAVSHVRGGRYRGNWSTDKRSSSIHLRIESGLDDKGRRRLCNFFEINSSPGKLKIYNFDREMGGLEWKFAGNARFRLRCYNSVVVWILRVFFVLGNGIVMWRQLVQKFLIFLSNIYCLIIQIILNCWKVMNILFLY